jgi:hypothetical protein
LFSPVRINFNSVAMRHRPFEQMGERYSVPNTGIERRELGREGETILQALCFTRREREEA